MPKIEKHKVPKLQHPIRLQEYGVGIFDLVFTKSALKKALKKDYITVNGVVATSATYIKGGETLCLNLPEQRLKKTKLKLKLKVVFEDEHLAIIVKPAGVLVSGNSFKTIVNALPQNLKWSIQADATQPQPVHRLDYPTTGLLLIGKTTSSIRALNTLFKAKNIKKTYYAVAIGNLPPKGIIGSTIDGKQAQTNYSVEASVASDRFGMLNLVKLEPITGRKHQLRKHLLSIGNPILGDRDYGKEPLILNGKGLYLHAFALKFTHPFTQETLWIKEELPKKFTKIFGLL